MNGDDTSHAILTSALGLLTATHADSRMAGPVTVDYLSGVPTDRSQMLDLVAGMAALATMLIQMPAEATGVAPEERLQELGRRIQELLSGFDTERCRPPQCREPDRGAKSNRWHHFDLGVHPGLEPYLYGGNWRPQCNGIGDRHRHQQCHAITTRITGVDTGTILGISPDGNRLYVGKGGGVAIIDTDANATIAAYPSYSPPVFALSPDGSRAYIRTGYSQLSVLTPPPTRSPPPSPPS
jgi:hypothetical protein